MTLQPLVDAAAIWRARLPDAVGTPAGERRPLIPSWPWLVLAVVVGAITAAMWLGPRAGWVGAVLGGIAAGGPVAVAYWRPGVAVVCCIAMNVFDTRFASVFEASLSVPPWFLNVVPTQLITAFAVGIALTARLAAGGIGLMALGGLLAVVVARPAITGVVLQPAVYWIVSVIAVRSVSASRRIAELPAAAVTEFDELGAAAREALGEMRQLLGMLDADAPAVADREPQPGLADIRRIVERTSGAGTPVELVLQEPVGVPATVAVSTCRIVQEALSNVTRHATGSPTVVRVGPDGSGDQLMIEIVNAPASAPAAAGAGSGRGMVGMRERARLLGGTFDAGATPAGGFAVRAELPLRGAR